MIFVDVFLKTELIILCVIHLIASPPGMKVGPWSPYEGLFKGGKRSTEGCSKFKSPETRQVQERLVLDIRTHASPKVGQDQVSGGVSVLCWHAAPVAYVLWETLHN